MKLLFFSCRFQRAVHAQPAYTKAVAEAVTKYTEFTMLKVGWNLIVVCLALSVVFEECKTAGTHNGGQRWKPNNERDYGILGNFITRVIDHWNTQQRHGDEQDEHAIKDGGHKQDVNKDKTKVVTKTSPCRGSTEMFEGRPKSGDSQMKSTKRGTPSGRPNSTRNYGLIGNLVALIGDHWQTNDVAPPNDSPWNPELEEDAHLSDRSKVATDCASDGKERMSERTVAIAGESNVESSHGGGDGAGQGPNHQDQSQQQEQVDEVSFNPRKLSPAEHLKQLLEPFVLNLMFDDGGLRSAVNKLETWEAKEGYENLDYIGGGISAL